VTGNEYADLIAAYLLKNYEHRGLVVYREVSLGKSIIGKNRKIDILALHQSTSRALGVECKYQATPGTADEKIPYTLKDLEAMHVPAFVSYAGEGFSVGVKHMLESHKLAAYCEPDTTLEPGKKTVELDHVVAMVFGWWDQVLSHKRPFALDAWRPSQEHEHEHAPLMAQAGKPTPK
jgi:hypothetical protein